MPSIKVIKPFRHVMPGEVHATEFEPGDETITVDGRTAQVAVDELRAAELISADDPEPAADGDDVADKPEPKAKRKRGAKAAAAAGPTSD